MKLVKKLKSLIQRLTIQSKIHLPLQLQSSTLKKAYSLQPLLLMPNLLLENVASQTLKFSAVSQWSVFKTS